MKFSRSDFEMQRFESRCPSQPVRSPMPHMRMSLNWRGGSGFEAGNLVGLSLIVAGLYRRSPQLRTRCGKVDQAHLRRATN